MVTPTNNFWLFPSHLRSRPKQIIFNGDKRCYCRFFRIKSSDDRKTGLLSIISAATQNNKCRGLTFILYLNKWTTGSRSVNFKSLKAIICMPLWRQRLFIQCTWSWTESIPDDDGESIPCLGILQDCDVWLRTRCKWLASMLQLRDWDTKSAAFFSIWLAPWTELESLNKASKGLALINQISAWWANMAVAVSKPTLE